ncbi:MAG TPA: 50S ribosomal protein L23 [Phototrophicaceae bacterium]|nr:50S ribosomal protein L23 [Phototrophicaceae bacterium]
MAELHLYDVIRRPVVSEKANIIAEERNQYVFEVADEATKAQIKQAVEIIFEKKVKKVNTMVMPYKRGMRGRNPYRRSSQWKKAIVTLMPGEKLDLFDL